MKRSILIGTAIVLALATFAVWATNTHVIWAPSHFIPSSVAPGETMNATVAFKNLGPSAIYGKKLSLEVQGEVAGIVSVAPPSFQKTIKKGDSVSISISVVSPINAPLSVVTGELVLLEVKPDGTTKQAFNDTLPLEITLSPFHLPPAPDTAEDEATIEGVDSDGNSVPDRVDRWIGFDAPNSEKKRRALTLSAKAQQDFIRDYLAHLGEDPEAEDVRERVRAMADRRAKAGNCLQYVLGANVGFDVPGARETWYAYNNKRKEIQVLFMDTPERLRAFWESERPLVATGYPSIPDNQYKQECLDLGLDPDQLPN